MKKILFFASVLLVTACTGSKLANPGQADADRVKPTYASATVESLKEGRALFKKWCQTCHELKMPETRSPEAWEKIVPPMVDKVNRKATQEVIDAAGKEKILHYVVSLSMAKE